MPTSKVVPSQLLENPLKGEVDARRLSKRTFLDSGDWKRVNGR